MNEQTLQALFYILNSRIVLGKNAGGRERERERERGTERDVLSYVKVLRGDIN